MFQYVWFAIYSLFLRGYRSGSGGLIGFIEKVLLKIPRKTQIKICNSSEKHMCKWVNNKKGQYFISSRIQNFNKCYPHDMFNETIKTKFNNKDYNILKKYDEVLRVFYGDYMQLPPEKERVWSHHPILIDFEYNFEDLIEDK